MVKNKKNNIEATKGKKIKANKIIFVLAIMLILLVILPGCTKVTYMDEEKCAEVALEYMEEKYGKEFEVISSKQPKGVVGRSDYVEVSVKEKITNNEEVFYITLYTDGKKDKDKDGYYDNYKVISDTYMCYLLSDYALKDVEELLTRVNLEDYYVFIDIKERIQSEGFFGCSENFPIIKENEISLINLLEQYRMDLGINIKIPENEYYNELEKDLSAIFQPLVSEDLIYIHLNTYENDKFYSSTELKLDYIVDKSFTIYIEGEENEFN